MAPQPWFPGGPGVGLAGHQGAARTADVRGGRSPIHRPPKLPACAQAGSEGGCGAQTGPAEACWVVRAHLSPWGCCTLSCALPCPRGPLWHWVAEILEPQAQVWVPTLVQPPPPSWPPPQGRSSWLGRLPAAPPPGRARLCIFGFRGPGPSLLSWADGALCPATAPRAPSCLPQVVPICWVRQAPSSGPASRGPSPPLCT